jgi:hypothetical protein
VQIVCNSIWFGERCKRLNINENWITHILSPNMGTSVKPLFLPWSSFYKYLSAPSLFHANPSSNWRTSGSHHPLNEVPFLGVWICWLRPNENGECLMQLFKKMMLHGCTIQCLHLYTSRWFWPLFHTSRLGFNPWGQMNLSAHQHCQNNYPLPWP